MNETSQTTDGLLTSSERELLTDEGSDSDHRRSEVLQRLSNRVSATLQDFMLLYQYLDDEEVETLFTDEDEESVGFRYTTQHAFAFLYYGLQLNGDMVDYRISSAIKQAEAARERHATVRLDITTEPFLPPEQRLQALKQDDFERVSIESFEHLFYDDRVSPEALADALVATGMEDTTAEDINKERDEAKELIRPPMSVVTDVEVVSDMDCSDEEDSETGSHDHE